jgi:hypothetical protein
MDKRFIDIICETENRWNNILFESDSFTKRKDAVRKMLNEAYGSIPGQFECAENIVKKLFSPIPTTINGVKTTKIEDNMVGVGNICVIAKWYNISSPYEKSVKGERKYINDVPTIILEIYEKEQIPYEIETTIAHEIMHCFQDVLPKVKGIDENSMILYRYLPEMFNFAPSYFSRMFFYGLYICYHIEVSANVSSISNFIEKYFKNRKTKTITTKEFQEALHECDKYKIYEDTLNTLTNVKPSQKDKEYIFQKMTGTFFNFLNNNEPTKLYDKENFDVNKFIQKNVKNIIKVCKETIFRMQKNIMIYKEKGD